MPALRQPDNGVLAEGSLLDNRSVEYLVSDVRARLELRDGVWADR